jgi:gliding motility-associated-like protein
MKKLLLILLCLPMIGFGQNSDTSSLILYIPNTFTPNSDGLNDTFYPKMTEIPNSFEMFIYNRRGMQIFHSADFFKRSWDGSNEKETSIYIYIINVVDAFNENFTYSGKISLIL